MVHNGTIGSGFFLAYGMGAILPDPDDFEANKEDELWRVIYLMPAYCGIIGLILLFFVFTEEPIAYCIMMGYEEQGKQHMRRVYRKADPDSSETIEELLES